MASRDETTAGRQAGFTLVELVVVMAVIGVMALWGYPALLNTLERAKLTGIARETALFMQRARMEAVKRSLNTEVIYLDRASCAEGHGCLLAFVDIDGDGAYIAGIDDVIAGPYPLPTNVELRAPGEVVEGGAAIDLWDAGADANDGPVFNTDGSAAKAGAFRFANGRGDYLEVRIEFVGTAKPTIQKWDGSAWWENGELGNTWEW